MFLDLIFPKSCLGCKKTGRYICRKCLSKLPDIKPICPVCEKASIDGLTHVKCVKKLSLDGLVSIWPYTGVVRGAIITMKYRFAYEIAQELVEYSCLCLVSIYPVKTFKNVILVPIPSYRRRYNWRGFNQSEVIGRRIARNFDWKFVPDLLVRKKVVLPQTGLKSESRAINIRGSFALNPKYHLLSTNYQLLLFDDVWTTGSTLREAGKVLKRNGFNQVWGLTIAR